MKGFSVAMLVVSVAAACIPPMDFLSGFNAGMAWFWLTQLLREVRNED